VNTPEEFRLVADELFEKPTLILAQKFLPTEFDCGSASFRRADFVCQYRMARGHWQIVKHRADGSAREGGFRTFDIEHCAARLDRHRGTCCASDREGFYASTQGDPNGFIVMEVNDNPNLEHRYQKRIANDEIWIKLLRFIERFATIGA